MPHIEIRGRAVAAMAPLVISLACLGLGACGSSTTGSSSSAPTPATSHTTPQATPTTRTTPTSSTPPTSTTPTSTNPAITSNRQFALIYKCMIRNGIKLAPINELGHTKINTNAPAYKAMLAKCSHTVLG
jgi:hypothetical protein